MGLLTTLSECLFSTNPIFSTCHRNTSIDTFLGNENVTPGEETEAEVNAFESSHPPSPVLANLSDSPCGSTDFISINCTLRLPEGPPAENTWSWLPFLYKSKFSTWIIANISC
jgi:hypothetical protein